MKKVFYDSLIAKAILFKGYSTITIFAWVFTKYKSLKQSTVNHECVHVRQWAELAITSAFIIWIGMLIFEYSSLYFSISAICFYLCYGLEYFLRLAIGAFNKVSDNQKKAYREISFEQEARLAEKDNNYLENSQYFGWIKFLIKNKQ